MVLGYLRTEDMSSDMQFKECSLDSIIREQIYKYASIFIGKKLKLIYPGMEERVLTDPKWLGFVIGQCLSNALKYTKTGGIHIYLSESRPHTLVIPFSAGCMCSYQHGFSIDEEAFAAGGNEQ